MKIDKKRTQKIVGRIELDYFHRMSPQDFRRVYGAPYYQIGIDREIYYIPAESIAALKNFFITDIKETLERGAKCKITDYINDAWLVEFAEFNHISDLDTTENLHIRYRK